jgi:hypothetical protein
MGAVSIEVTDILKVDKSGSKSAAETLARAFRTYPLVQYYFSDEVKRDKVTHYFLSFSVFSGIRYGEVYATSANFEGVAVWMPPGTYPLTLWRVIRSVPPAVLLGFARYGGGKMRDIGEFIDSVHQRLAPFKHWFLQIDKEGLPCYLETLDEQNVALYEHFGFKVVDKSTIPDTSFTNWAMLRE